MTMVKKIFTAVIVLLLSPSNDAFYIPGVALKSFQKSDIVEMKVNAITSTHTQIPKNYYNFPFCVPKEGPKMASENLGEFLTGNKIQSSAYEIRMLEEVTCQKVCQIELDKKGANRLQKHIMLGYRNNWIVDNLPSANIGMINGELKRHYAGGFPIGFIEGEMQKKKKDKMPDAFVYNHVNIVLDYHTQEEGYRVVGFAVEALSIKHEFEEKDYVWKIDSEDGMTKPLKSCPLAPAHVDRKQIKGVQPVVEGEKIIYTYDVSWKESDVAWSSRWDIYLSEDHLIPAQVHWYSITNSIFIVVFLSTLVISVLVRNLKRDIAAYNELALLVDEEEQDEVDDSGWKLVHADVFRPPDNCPMLFCIFVGSGVQVGVTFLTAICLSAVGYVSPARRGSMVNVLLVFYMLCGIISGYVSSRLYKTFRGRQWQLCTAGTALLLPGAAFTMFLVFNIYLWFLKSSASAPILDVVILAAMWCCVSVPLVFLGAYFGYRNEAIEMPTVTSTIARAIPPQPLYLHPKLVMSLVGFIPFSTAYVELFFIMNSLWMDQYYYVFGCTLVVYLILLVTSAEMTVLAVYYQLCGENHRWWWFSFGCSGSISCVFFLYSCHWFKSLEASRMVMTYLLYFGYMFIISFMMMLVFGAVGALSSFWFVRKIFGTIKVD